MSEVSQHASLSLILADFAMMDATGKLSVVGGGVAMLGFQPEQGLTTRISLVAIVDVPSAYLPAECAIEVMLEQHGELVQLPGPAGPQALRIGQATTIEKPQLPGPVSVRDQLSSRHIVVLDFGTGLPLAPGGVYNWVLQIDGDEANRLRYPFAVAAGAIPPVIG
ncbi:MAG TPA: hypothetical protein VIP82_20675 [Microbacterium sp.]|uniref:hypothetical protein n=1 Tax=Microbacterium sp. TaxID=51671 RepID=UPI002F929189